MGITGAGAGAGYIAAASLAVGAATTVASVHASRKSAEEAEANRPGAPPSPGLTSAQSTQATINNQQSLNAQSGAFSNPAISNAPNAQRKSVLG